MSNNSWKQYGGISKTNDFNTINASTIIADQFVSRAVRATYQLLNGTFEVTVDVLAGNSMYANNDVFSGRDMYTNNKIFFGNGTFTKSGTNLPSLTPAEKNTYAYLYGNENNIGVNTMLPKTCFNITGNTDEVTGILTVESKNELVRNIIAQNKNQHGIVVNADDASSNILFYNDISTNSINIPDAMIKYQDGGLLTTQTTERILSTAKVIQHDSSNNTLLMDSNGTTLNSSGYLDVDISGVIDLYTDTEFKFDCSNTSIFTMNDTSTNIITNGDIKLFTDNKNIVFDTSGGVIEFDSGDIKLNTLLKFSPPERGISNELLHNETMTIYDNSNRQYLPNVYNDHTILTGNSISCIGKDPSSNTFIFMNPATRKDGGAIGGGMAPHDASRAMTVIGTTDSSGNYIPSQMTISSTNKHKYVSTVGINTHKPKTEDYVLDVNGPIHMGNGEINTVADNTYEITYMNFSKTHPGYGIAVGSPSTTTGSGVNTTDDALLTSGAVLTAPINAGTYTGLTTTSSGNGSEAVLTIVATENQITSITVTNSGKGYAVNDTLKVTAAVLTNANTGRTTDLTFTLDANNIVDVAEYKQLLLYTIDGGKKWSISDIFEKGGLNTDNSVIMKHIHVFNNLYSAIAGESGNLFLSKDSGQSWYKLQLNNVPNPETIDYKTINIIEHTNGTNTHRIFISYTTGVSTDGTTGIYYFDCNLTTIFPPNDTTIYIETILDDATGGYQLGPSVSNYFITSASSTNSRVYYAGINGIFCYDNNDNTLKLENTSYNYNNIYAFDDIRAIAIGTGGGTDGGISYTVDGINWINKSFTQIGLSSMGGRTFNSVFIQSLSNAIAVGSQGEFIYSTDWQNEDAVWQMVPDNLLNSSGMRDRIRGTENNLKSISMPDADTIIIADTITSFVPDNDFANSALGYSKIQYCFLPALFNRSNNSVLDVSGNTVIDGKLIVVDNIDYKNCDSSTTDTINIGTNTHVVNIGKTDSRSDIDNANRAFSNSESVINIGVNNPTTQPESAMINIGNWNPSASTTRNFINIGGGNDKVVLGGKVEYTDTSISTSKNKGFQINDYNLHEGIKGYLNVSETATTDADYQQAKTTAGNNGTNIDYISYDPAKGEYVYPIPFDSSNPSFPFDGSNPDLETHLTNTYANDPFGSAAGAGIFISDNLDRNAGYLKVSNDMDGWVMKPTNNGSNSIKLDVNSMTLRVNNDGRNEADKNIDISYGIPAQITNGIVMLTRTSDTDCSYALTVQQLDVNNILIRDSGSTHTDQTIKTNLSVEGNLDVAGGLTATTIFQNSIVNTTTNNYEVIISQDMSLNGILYVDGDASFNSNMDISGNLAIGKRDPVVTLDISATDALRLPVGTTTGYTTGRPIYRNSNGYLQHRDVGVLAVTEMDDEDINKYIGSIRYNSSTSQFEGFGPGNNWGSLGGVINVAQNTKIIAESTPASTNNQLQFFTGPSENNFTGLVTTINVLLTSANDLTDTINAATYTGLTTTSSGNGSGAILTIVATENQITTVAVTTAGSGYAAGDTLTIDKSQLPNRTTDLIFTLNANHIGIKPTGLVTTINALLTSADNLTHTINNGTYTINSISTVGSGTGAQLRIIATENQITSVTVTSPGRGYATGDTLTIAGETSAGVGNSQLTGRAEDLIFTLNADDIVGTTIERMIIDDNGNIGIGINSPNCILDINGTDALRIPVGTNSQRPANLRTGQIRYNTSTSQFEGYNNSFSWQGLGGVIDVNQDTMITAESSPTTDNNQLRFYTAYDKQPRLQMIIDASSGGVAIGTTYATNVTNNLDISDNSLLVEGRVCIGTDNPFNADTKLEVNGSIRAVHTSTTPYISYFGNAAIGWNTLTGTNNEKLATFSHKDHNSETGYALQQTHNGKTDLNAASNQSIAFCIGNAAKMTISGDKIQMVDNTNPINFGVKGNVAIGDNYYSYNSSVNNNAPANGLIVEGNVGIGTTTPSYALDINDGIIRTNYTASTILHHYPFRETIPGDWTQVAGNGAITIENNSYTRLTHDSYITSPTFDLSGYMFYTDGSSVSGKQLTNSRILIKMIGRSWSQDNSSEYTEISILNADDNSLIDVIYKDNGRANNSDSYFYPIICDLKPYITTSVYNIKIKIAIVANGHWDFFVFKDFSICLDDNSPWYKDSVYKQQILGGASIGVDYVGQNLNNNELLVQGNVGIGTTSPQTNLDISNNIFFDVSHNTGSTTYTNIITGADAYNGSSGNLRLKGGGEGSNSYIDINSSLDTSSLTLKNGQDDLLNGITGTSTYLYDLSFTNTERVYLEKWDFINNQSAETPPHRTTGYIEGFHTYSGTPGQTDGTGTITAIKIYSSNEIGFAPGDTCRLYFNDSPELQLNFTNIKITLTSDHFVSSDDINLVTNDTTRVHVNNDGNVGIGTTSPNCILDINSTNAIRLPVGIDSERPIQNTETTQTEIDKYKGSIRYNSANSQFEGYGPGNAWGSLGGVINVAQNTKITASSPDPDSSNNQLQFYTAPKVTPGRLNLANNHFKSRLSNLTEPINNSPGFYVNLPITGGSGSGAEARVDGGTGGISHFYITTPGSGYIKGDTLTIDKAGVPGRATDIVFTLTTDGDNNTLGGDDIILDGTIVDGPMAERMIVDSNGNVGIGTTTPQTNLDISNNIFFDVSHNTGSTTYTNIITGANAYNDISGNLRLKAGGEGSNNYIDINSSILTLKTDQDALLNSITGTSFDYPYTNTHGGVSNEVYLEKWDFVNSVAVTPANRTAEVRVVHTYAGGIASITAIEVLDAGSGYEIGDTCRLYFSVLTHLHDPNNAYHFANIKITLTAEHFDGGGVINLVTNNTIGVHVGGGNVGIGTDDPEGLLHISSVDDAILKITADNTNNQDDGTKHPYLIFQQDGGHNEAGIFLGTHDNGTNEQYMGDGKENDLIISAYDTNGGNIYFKTGNSTSGTGTDISSLKSATTRMMINENGKVSIGTISIVSGYTLYVIGAVQATAYNATSDIRHKENVCDLENALEKINAIRGVNFNFKDDDKIHSGVIAQEVADIIPEAICKNNDEKWSANYNTFIGYLIESVKTLSKENEELKEKVNTLETKIEMIMKHLNL